MTDIANFPLLTRDEFEEACHHLDRKYRGATLGWIRLRWKLRVRTALQQNFSNANTPRTLIEITRVLEESEEDLGLNLDALAFSDSNPLDMATEEVEEADDQMMEDEASDQEALRKTRPTRDCGYVTYEIILHPTYQLPCLYFRLWGLPNGEPPFSLDTVFRRLVPDAYKDGLRSPGGVGGISMDHHPIYGEPCFFVHPCMTADAMAAFECSREDYLTIWIGLTGACVGLSVPKEMMISHDPGSSGWQSQ